MNNVRSIYKHLQERWEYEKRYDQMTIEECKRHIQISENIKLDPNKYKPGKSYSLASARKVVLDIGLYFVQGEAYVKRETTIQKWMEEDGKKDASLQNAHVPTNIHCDSCYQLMEPESNMLDHSSDDLKVMFMFRCYKGCKLGKVVYEDGTIWINPSSLCPNCKIKLESSSKRIKSKIFTTDSCSHCGYKRKDELDLTVEKEVIDPHFSEDRKRFCLSYEEGEKYRQSYWNYENMNRINKDFEERQKKEKDPVFQKAKKLKKLTVVELEQLLLKTLNKKDYTKLNLGAPEMEQYIIVPFTIQEISRKRNNRESNLLLKRIIDRALEGTNWRLMSEGISYRLGILSGRLKAYEREEDLVNLVK